MPAIIAALWNSPHFVLVGATLMWAGHTIAARLSVGEMSPLLLMAMRWAACLAILLMFYHRQVAIEWPKVRARLGWVAVMGGFGMAGFTIFFILAAQYTSAVNLGIMQGSIPAFVMLIGLVLFGTAVGLVQIGGLIACLTGVAVLVTGGSLELLLEMTFNRGDLLMLVACLCYAGYTVGLSRRIAMSPVVMLTFFSVPATLMLIACVWLEYAQGALILPGIKGLLIVLYCAIFPSMLAQIFFMRGVELAGPTRSGLYINLVPIFAALMAVFFLSEDLYIYHLLSLGMVLGGIYLAERHKPDTQAKA